MTDTHFDKLMIRIFGDDSSVLKKDLLPESDIANILINTGLISIVLPTAVTFFLTDSYLPRAGAFFVSFISSLGIIAAGYILQYLYDIRNIMLKQWELPRA